ncbi:MAG TPA: hypothetical protein PLG86_05730 [Bacteroidales bacterium]|jgi:hypothetical protein|nr:hypothetical protein [Bacteroidales bacterium]HPT04619.1 hypothetical protein [Bacteroidales bacterium]
MKKLFLILAIVVFFGLIITSCKTREKCPAYQEYSKYQIEKNH